ncbi:MAG: FAD-dependent oxidoreductase [Acidimicrobiia bacterium]
MTQFPRLFSPITIGRTELRNRIALAPMATRMAGDGTVDPREIAWGVERARGGAALIISGGIHVHPTSQPAGNLGRQVEGWRRDGLESHRRRVDAIHAHDAKVFAQLAHVGRDAIMEQIGPRMEQPLLAPSALRSPGAEWAPMPMMRAEIRTVVKAFGGVAEMLVGAGYDGIEIHGGHGYLVAQFLSRTTNQRSDAYGGSLENRSRFLTDIVQEIRERCGDGITLGVRFSAVEEVPGGLTIDDTKRLVEIVEAAGAIDYVSLTVGVRGAYVKDNTTPPGFAVQYARSVSATTSLPVMIAGRITTVELAERILEDGAADVVAMARALIADPLLPLKAKEGRVASIRPCLGFSQECRLTRDGVTCGVNPVAGRETIWSAFDEEPSTNAKRVVIAGGGPAGMEAARVAASMGHGVVLFERDAVLGGQLRRVARLPFREDFNRYAEYLEHEVRELGVEVRLGVHATAELIIAESPDAVIIATGSGPGQLPASVIGASVPVVRTWDLFDGGSGPLGPTILVVDDGSGFWPVCGAADLLAARGAIIEFITPNAVIGRSIPHESLVPLHRRLRGAGAVYSPFTRLVEVVGGTATVADTITGAQRDLAVDAVVIDVPNIALADLMDQLPKAIPTYNIGDSFAVRRLSYATLEANRAIRDLDEHREERRRDRRHGVGA